MELSITNYNNNICYGNKFIKPASVGQSNLTPKIKKSGLFKKLGNLIKKLIPNKNNGENCSNKKIENSVNKQISLKELFRKLKSMPDIKDREIFLDEWIKTRAEYGHIENEKWFGYRL